MTTKTERDLNPEVRRSQQQRTNKCTVSDFQQDPLLSCGACFRCSQKWWRLKLSLAQLFDRCPPRPAVAADHVSRRSDANANTASYATPQKTKTLETEQRLSASSHHLILKAHRGANVPITFSRGEPRAHLLRQTATVPVADI